jgi:hypothetical protein
MLIRLILFLFLLTGCALPSPYWGNWSEWSGWRHTRKSESRTLKITSEPTNSKVYINERFEGSTPLTVNISYPVLKSERKRCKYRGRKVIDSEKDVRDSLKSATHKVTVKRRGYRPAYKLISHDDSYAHLILKEKLCLFFNNIRVEDESERSFAQKVYDSIFTKKYKKKVELGYLLKIFGSNKHFKDIFIFSGRKKGCNALDCKLVIRNDYTDLGIVILDDKGNEVAESSSKFKTSFERDEFLSDLGREIDKGTYKIYRTLCEE